MSPSMSAGRLNMREWKLFETQLAVPLISRGSMLSVPLTNELFKRWIHARKHIIQIKVTRLLLIHRPKVGKRLHGTWKIGGILKEECHPIHACSYVPCSRKVRQLANVQWTRYMCVIWSTCVCSICVHCCGTN